MKNKVLHLLTWKLKDIEATLPKIKSQGFTHIQISPVEPTKDGEDWWNLYQPLSFTIGNRLGSKQDFIDLCYSAHKCELQIIVDVVVRHLAGRDDGSSYPHERCDKRFLDNPNYWLTFEQGDMEHNRYDCTHKSCGMPVVNYFNLEVQAIIQDFFTEILTYADGIRIDQLKHFCLPSEGSELLNMIKYNFTNKKWIYGEAIELDNPLLNEYTNYCDVLSNTHIPWNRERYVSMAESHDTYYTWGYTKNCSDEWRLCNYGELLDKFNSVIFFARPYDNLPFSERMKQINNLY